MTPEDGSAAEDRGDAVPGRRVEPFHARRELKDADFEAGLSAFLADRHDRQSLERLYERVRFGADDLDVVLRRAVWRVLARRLGHGLLVEEGVGFTHLETFEIGHGVYIGANVRLQGRHDGNAVIGDRVWIGAQAFLDARDLVVGDYVGIAPGVKVIGSVHVGMPLDVPVIDTKLEIRPVRIGRWTDIGANAVVMPGVTIGDGCMIGAGAVVTHDIPPLSIAAGVPARVLRRRDEPSRRRS